MDLDIAGGGAKFRPAANGPLTDNAVPVGSAAQPQSTAELAGAIVTRTSEMSARETLQEASERLEAFVRESGRELEFRVGDSGGQVVIVVRQADSGEVLRTIPPDEALRLARELDLGGSALLSTLA